MLSCGHHMGLLPRCPQTWDASRVREKGPSSSRHFRQRPSRRQLYPDRILEPCDQSTEPAGDPPGNRKDVLSVTTGLRLLRVPTDAFP